MAGDPGAPGLILLQRGGSTNSRQRFSNRGRAVDSNNSERTGRTRVKSQKLSCVPVSCPPEVGFGAGMLKLTRNSPGCSTVRPGAVQNDSTGTSRVPLGPAMTQTASWTINAGMVSAAGDALHRLPPTLARL